jgi:hypothetical protein
MVKVRMNESWYGRSKKDKMPPKKEYAPAKFQPYYTEKFNGAPENRPADSEDKRGSYDIACERVQTIGWTNPKSYPWRQIKEYHEILRKQEQEQFEAKMAGHEWGKYTRKPGDDGDRLAEEMRQQLRVALNVYWKNLGIYKLTDLYVSVYGFSRYGSIGDQSMLSITLGELLREYQGAELTKWCRMIIGYWIGEDFRFLEEFQDAARFWTGWTLKSSTNGRGIILAATYGPGFKEWRDKAVEDWQNAHRRPQRDPYGYGGGPGNWTGD